MAEKVVLGVEFGDLTELVSLLEHLEQVQKNIGNFGASGATFGGGGPAATPVPPGGFGGSYQGPPPASVPVTNMSPAAAGVPTASFVPTGTMTSSPGGVFSGTAAQQVAQSQFAGQQVAQMMATQAIYGGGGSMTFGAWNASTGQTTPLSVNPGTGPVFNPMTGMGMAGVGWPGSNGGGGSGDKALTSAISAQILLQQLSPAVQQVAGSWSQAVSSGSPFYWETATSAGAPAIGTLLGAAIGSVVPGIGTLVGGMVGGGVGGLYSAIAGPLFDRNSKEEDLRRIAKSVGFLTNKADPAFYGLSTDVIAMAHADMMSGRYLPRDTYRSINDRMAPDQRALQHDVLSRSAYTTGNVARYGIPHPDRPYSFRDMANLDIGDSYGNELQNSDAIFQLARNALAHGDNDTAMFATKAAIRTRGMYADRVRLEGEGTALPAEFSVAQTKLDLAGRYYGSRGVSAAAGDVNRIGAAEVANLRSRAQLMAKYGNPYEARALNAQADQMETSLRFATGQTFVDRLREEDTAASSLQLGTADRSFQRALYGGSPVDAMPFEQRVSAYRSQGSRMRGELQEMKRLGLPISPAMQAQYDEQIAQADFMATTGISREREQMRNRQLTATTELGIASFTASHIGGVISGDRLTQSTGEFDIRLQALQKEKALKEEILSTSKMLTYEERIQIQASIEANKEQQTRLGFMREVAAIAAKTANVDYLAGMNTAGSQVRLIGGLSSGGSVRELLGQAGQMSIQISQHQANIKELRSFGYDANSREVQGENAAIADLQVKQAAAMQGVAVAPISPGLEVRESHLRTQYRIMQSGFGSFGDMRSNLLEQAKASKERLTELDSGKVQVMKSGAHWTANMERAYQLERDQVLSETADLAMQYSNGWDQRLISEAFNMPASGRLALTGFTKREASLFAGILHPSFGGSESQTRGYRDMLPNILSAFRTGNPSALTKVLAGGHDMPDGSLMPPQRSLGPDSGPMRVEFAPLTIKVEMPDGGVQVHTVNARQVSGLKNAQDLNDNPGARWTKGS